MRFSITCFLFAIAFFFAAHAARPEVSASSSKFESGGSLLFAKKQLFGNKKNWEKLALSDNEPKQHGIRSSSNNFNPYSALYDHAELSFLFPYLAYLLSATEVSNNIHYSFIFSCLYPKHAFW